MGHRLGYRLLGRAWVIALLTALSSLSVAAEKSYTVTAPDGVRIAVQEAGNPDGPAIIFIHGLLGSRLNWEKQTGSVRSCSAIVWSPMTYEAMAFPTSLKNPALISTGVDPQMIWLLF